MKTQTLLTSLLFAGTLVFVGCGDDITKNYESAGTASVASIDEAGKCESANLGALVFNEETQSLFVCNGKKWIDLGVSQGDAPEIPDSLLNVDCSFGSTSGGWLRMVCGDKVVDSVKIGQNGQSGCTMKRLGEGYVVTCDGKVVDTLYSGSTKTAFDLKFVSQRNPHYAEAKYASDVPLLSDTTLTVSVENFRGASKIKTITWFVQADWFEDFAVVEGNQPYVLELSNITSTPGFDPIRDLGTRIRFVAAVTTEDGETTVAADSTRFYLSFVDERDTTVYPLVYARANFWMAANLNYGARVDLGEAQQAGEKWCPGDDEAQCAKFGALYQWHTAFGLGAEADTAFAAANSVVVAGDTIVQGICPDGWKIPNTTAWMDLISVAEGEPQNLISKKYGGNGLVAWNGTLAGLYEPPQADAPAPWDQGLAAPTNTVAAYWRYGRQETGRGSSTAYAQSIMLVDRIYTDVPSVGEMYMDKTFGLALRCVAVDPCATFYSLCI